VKELVGAFNQEKALVGAFSVIVKTDNRLQLYWKPSHKHVLSSLPHWKVNGDHEAWFLSALKGQGGGVWSRLTGQRQLQAPLSITGLTSA